MNYFWISADKVVADNRVILLQNAAEISESLQLEAATGCGDNLIFDAIAKSKPHIKLKFMTKQNTYQINLETTEKNK